MAGCVPVHIDGSRLKICIRLFSCQRSIKVIVRNRLVRGGAPHGCQALDPRRWVPGSRGWRLITVHYPLPTELVGVTGIEPVTSSLSGTRSNRLSYTPVSGFWSYLSMASENWWRQPGSNRRHPACKAGALPTELCPRRRESVGSGQWVVVRGRTT